MTGSKVKCISKKVADIFPTANWKKVEIFNPGEELLQLKRELIMEVLENFKDLFIDVWKEGISGVNISEIIIALIIFIFFYF